MNIPIIMGILDSEYKKFKEPSMTEISKTASPFKVLIGTLISLRTKDAVTISATERLFQLGNDPKDMLKLTQDEIAKAIYPCSFFNVKAGRIIEISRILVSEYNGFVPDDLDELLKLPGVGRKTANLTMTLGHRKLGLCVDIHVHRISNRLGLIKTKTPDESEFALRDLLPKKYWIPYNDYLVAYGQNICTPVSPHCSICKLTKCCGKVEVVKSR